jgi:basic amino acid/polyamine antiporter, APA family
LQDLAGSLLTGDQLAFWLRQAFTVLVILSLAFVNVRGVRWGGSLQLFITTIKVGSLVAVMVLPFLALWRFVDRPVTLDNLRPVWPSVDQLTPHALSHFGAALVGVLWAYHGWMNITPVAEEVRNPQRNLPIALLAGAGIVTVLYVGVNASYALVIPQQQMAQMHEHSPQDRAEDIQVDPADTSVAIGFSRRLFGPAGVALAAAAVMISVFGGLNGNLLAGPRILFAMGEEGLAPRPLGVVHARYHTPARAILALALWSILLVLAAALLKQFPIPTLTIADTSLNLNPPANKPLFDILTDLAMFGAVLFETLAVSSIFVLRYRLPHAERPYRCWGYPYVPVIYVVILVAVAFQMFLNHRAEALAGVGFIAGGAVLYAGFLRVPSSAAQSGHGP